MMKKNDRQECFEDAVTSRMFSILLLNYVKVVYKLQCAIKMSG